MLDALQAFVDVAASGNFSKVAQAENVAVSSVTRRVEMLETSLGARLFTRSTRSVLLTDAGHQFLPRAQAILAEWIEAQDSIASLNAEPRGVLRVTGPTTFGRRYLAPLIAPFLERHPLLEVELELSDDIFDLEAQRFDVAVRIGVLRDSDLLATRLAPQRRVACASPAYLARNGRPAKPEDLVKHNCLTQSSRVPRVGWWQFADVNGGRPLEIHGSLRSDSSEVLLQAALDGMGVAHLATWMVFDEIASGRLVPLFDTEWNGPPVSASAIVAVRFPHRAVRRAKLFIDHLRDSFDVQGGGPPVWDQRPG